MTEQVTVGTPPRTMTIARPYSVEPGLWRTRVTLSAPGLEVTREVFEMTSGVFDPNARKPQVGDLARFLEALAQDWRGWDGEREWTTRSYELRMQCRHDRVGHITCVATLAADDHLPFVGRSWEAKVVLTLEPGHLDGLATELAALLAPGAT